MQRNYRHVVFDLDGTLADTAGDIANAANHARRALGLSDLPRDTVRGCIGDGARQLVARIVPGATEPQIDAALRTFLDHYTAHLLDETRLYAGIDELLAELARAGITCSVLSNKPASLCHQLLLGLGISHRFLEILGGDSLPAKKPDPCGLVHLQAGLRFQASDLLFVGDSRIDWQTAAAAGVAFCGVTWGFAADGLLRGGARMANQPAEISALVLGDQSPARRLSS